MPQRLNTTGDVGTALDGQTLNMAFILRLDVVDDPLFAWTGYGDLTFAANETGDPALDGQTFTGITHLIAEIGTVDDAHGGSNALEIVLPGIDLTDEGMRKVLGNKYAWQFKPARVWLVFLDDDGQVIGKPIRMRSGKIDQLKAIEDDDGMGSVKCTIESQQAYAGEALNTRYSEQSEIDPTDLSQRYVWQLANMNPIIGKRTVLGTVGNGSSSGGGSTGNFILDALIKAGKV